MRSRRTPPCLLRVGRGLLGGVQQAGFDLPPLQQCLVTPRPLERPLASRRHRPSGPDMHGSKQVVHRAQMPRMWANWFEEHKNQLKSFFPFPHRHWTCPDVPPPRRIQTQISLTLSKSLLCLPESHLHRHARCHPRSLAGSPQAEPCVPILGVFPGLPLLHSRACFGACPGPDPGAFHELYLYV